MLVSALVLACTSAPGHEFWVLPDRFDTGTDEPFALSMWVGQDFRGERVGVSNALVVRARMFTARGVRDLADRLPAAPGVAQWPVQPFGTGAQLVAIDTNPSSIVLPAQKFTEYLQLEGLEGVLAQRQRSGTADTPGRERYRRNIKTFVNAGSSAGAERVLATRTGQRLEIVPDAASWPWHNGRTWRMRLYFDGKPLAGALVKFWHRDGDTLTTARAVTSAAGAAEFTPEAPGLWMVSTVHMIPATDTPDFDWDSYWANVTFELPR